MWCIHFSEMGGVKMDGMEEARVQSCEEVSKSTMTSYDGKWKSCQTKARNLFTESEKKTKERIGKYKLGMLQMINNLLNTYDYLIFCINRKGITNRVEKRVRCFCNDIKLTKQSQILSFQFTLLGVSGDEIKSAQIAIREEWGGTVDGSRQNFLSNLINTSAQIGMSASDLIVMRENTE